MQLDIPVVLPGVDDVCDGCVMRFQERLSTQDDIPLAHLEERDGKRVLCLHYDPNLMQLARLERQVHAYTSELAAIIPSWSERLLCGRPSIKTGA